ncbi:MAG TPA: hypothetical protein VGO52_08930 [Hyphomonadaceae bacterium]|jgi:hypothetical protein|nr:hypothetical protein [Hyphomonadaceae bacterium]
MRDYIFFPLAAILAAVFVLMGLQPWAERVPTGPLSCGRCANPEDVTADGKELHRFVPGNYNGLEIVTPDGGGAPVLQITRAADEQYGNPESGPHVVIDSDLECTLAGREIEVIVTARSVGGIAADKFEVDYFARADAEGESGWRDFALTREFKDYPFNFKTPNRGGVMGFDVLGIRPVAPDKRRTMEVKAVRIHAVGPPNPLACTS